jgi:hypothetical protein
MNLDDLCIALAKCNRSEEVKNILQDKGYWDDEQYWRDFGDNPNNYSTIGNQQSKPINALIEKMVNSGDSILTSKVIEAGIDPEDPSSAPQSMKDAMDKYLKVPNGDIYQLSQSKRNMLGDECGGMVVTGDDKNPTYSIFDFGEGQSPESFPKTFCGISQSNKQQIAFVQGKHCSGATGALVFVEEGIQLIISRRSPLVNDGTLSDDIGFTVTRRSPAGAKKSPTYKYLIINGEVPRFPSKPLSILPALNDKKDAFCRNWEYGAFIKLFDYKIGPTIRSKGNIDLHYKLSVHLINPVFPIRIYERRPTSGKAHSPEITLSGLLTRLDTDRSQHIEEDSPFGFSFNVDNQSFTGEIYVLKSSTDRRIWDRFHGNDGVLFTVNGQANAFLSNSIYRRKKIGLDYIANKIITIINCTELDNDHHADLFQNDRERLKDTEFKADVMQEIETTLATHQGLKDLSQKHREETVKDKLADNKPLDKVMEKLIKSSPSLNSILLKGARINNPMGMGIGNNPWQSSKFPTFFDLEKKHKNFTKKSPRKVEANRKSTFTFITDAPNDYISRTIDPGSYEVFENGILINNQPSLHGSNGKWHLNLNSYSSSAIGQIFEINIKIMDVSRVTPLEQTFWIETIPYQKKVGGGKGGSSAGQAKNNTTPGFKLPPIARIYKNDWPDHNWHKESVFKFVKNNNVFDTYVNMDNIHLLTELKTAKNEADKEVIKTQYTLGLALISMNMSQLNLNTSEFTDVEKSCEEVSKALGPIIIPMIRDLGSSISG